MGIVFTVSLIKLSLPILLLKFCGRGLRPVFLLEGALMGWVCGGDGVFRMSAYEVGGADADNLSESGCPPMSLDPKAPAGARLSDLFTLGPCLDGVCLLRGCGDIIPSLPLRLVRAGE